MSKLPPWQARNERDRKAMSQWTRDQLDKAHVPYPESYSAEALKVARDWVASDGPALEAWRRRDIAPLQKRYPHLSETFQPPKLARGEKRPKPKPLNSAQTAMWAVKQIRDEIWPQHFDGKTNRRADDGPSAEEIVAEWLDESIKDIKRWTHGKSGPSGLSNKQKQKHISRAK